MEGTAGLIPHCLPTPAARNAQDPGSSVPAVALRRAVHSISSTAGLDLAPVHSRGVPRTSRGASPQTCGLCRGIPPLALPPVSAASLPSLVKTPTIPFLGLIPPVLGKNRRPFPSPAMVALSRGTACRATAHAPAACKWLFKTALLQGTLCPGSSCLAGEARLVPALRELGCSTCFPRSTPRPGQHEGITVLAGVCFPCYYSPKAVSDESQLGDIFLGESY